jgi:hypothetical protein
VVSLTPPLPPRAERFAVAFVAHMLYTTAMPPVRLTGTGQEEESNNRDILA